MLLNYNFTSALFGRPNQSLCVSNCTPCFCHKEELFLWQAPFFKRYLQVYFSKSVSVLTCAADSVWRNTADNHRLPFCVWSYPAEGKCLRVSLSISTSFPSFLHLLLLFNPKRWIQDGCWTLKSLHGKVEAWIQSEGIRWSRKEKQRGRRLTCRFETCPGVYSDRWIMCWAVAASGSFVIGWSAVMSPAGRAAH